MWEEVEGDRMFFCCDLCARQFRSLIERIERETGWPAVDEVEITGDRRGRTCRAHHSGAAVQVRVAFTADGGLLRFQRTG